MNLKKLTDELDVELKLGDLITFTDYNRLHFGVICRFMTATIEVIYPVESWQQVAEPYVEYKRHVNVNTRSILIIDFPTIRGMDNKKLNMLFNIQQRILKT